MSYSYKPNRETHIHTKRIAGIPVGISDQKGGLLIWGKPSYQGKSIRFFRDEGGVVDGSFSLYIVKGRQVCVAVISRITPGNYHSYLAGLDGISARTSVTGKWVSQVDLRNN
jgi:hypothetical protein